ncbi:7SK snRNA methylphosphate capping enzyme-like [Tubulanus polymorphus]|uniref:7SK snRNA methylphosphate capping enzyme-like n=1 Tax=Tubulanus polymorphus TaxID=672921 RepID=UPI003DA5F53C
MSVVDVKTPPQFSHAGEFPHYVGAAATPAENLMAVSTSASSKDGKHAEFKQRFDNNRDRFEKGGGNPRGRKRFNSVFGGAQRGGFGRRRSRHNSEKIVLPTKFLLGGNISDPLNLNSLTSEDPNEKTPVSSPLPTPMHRREQEIDVIIPPNITDPLNLNSGEDLDFASPKTHKRKRNKHKRRSADGCIATVASLPTENPALKIDTESSDVTRPISIDINSEKASEKITKPAAAHKSKVDDKIVSPVIPQISPKSRKRKRQTSDSRPEPSANLSISLLKDGNDASSATKNAVVADEIVSPVECTSKFKRQQSVINTAAGGKPSQKQRANAPKKKFIYGNYNRYYGYRNPNMDEDYRLKCLKKEWITGKDVLDIGCNVGHVTLAIARQFTPRKIVGLDIDPNLIAAARKNIRHYLSSELAGKGKFPDAMSSTYGPIVSKKLPESDVDKKLLNNIRFAQANYVPESDELLELVKEEYDVILAFSLTKWMHLHNGDAGLKRAFKRMFKQLRPGGILLLEPQSWSSYKKKKNLTESISKVFKSISFYPDQFSKYLLSTEVGFSTCQVLDVPFNKSKGFRRPLQMYRKLAKEPSAASDVEHEPVSVPEPMQENPTTTELSANCDNRRGCSTSNESTVDNMNVETSEVSVSKCSGNGTPVVSEPLTDNTHCGDSDVLRETSTDMNVDIEDADNDAKALVTDTTKSV